MKIFELRFAAFGFVGARGGRLKYRPCWLVPSCFRIKDWQDSVIQVLIFRIARCPSSPYDARPCINLIWFFSLGGWSYELLNEQVLDNLYRLFNVFERIFRYFLYRPVKVEVIELVLDLNRLIMLHLILVVTNGKRRLVFVVVNKFRLLDKSLLIGRWFVHDAQTFGLLSRTDNSFISSPIGDMAQNNSSIVGSRAFCLDAIKLGCVPFRGHRSG